MSNSQSQLTLIKIDSAVHAIICGPSNIRSLAKKFTDAAETLANGIDAVLDSSPIRNDFVRDVGTLITKYRDKDVLLLNLAKLLKPESNPRPERQTVLANIRALLRDVAVGPGPVRFGCGSLPQVFSPPAPSPPALALDSGLSKLAVRVDGTIPTNSSAEVRVVRGLDPAPAAAIKFELPAALPFEVSVAGFILKTTPKPGRSTILSDLESALKQSEWSDGNARDVAVTFFDTAGGFLGITVQRTIVEAAGAPTYLLSPQNTSVLVPKGGETKLRIGCKVLGTAQALRFSAKITLFSADPTAIHELVGPTTGTKYASLAPASSCKIRPI